MTETMKIPVQWRTKTVPTPKSAEPYGSTSNPQKIRVLLECGDKATYGLGSILKPGEGEQHLWCYSCYDGMDVATGWKKMVQTDYEILSQRESRVVEV